MVGGNDMPERGPKPARILGLAALACGLAGLWPFTPAAPAQTETPPVVTRSRSTVSARESVEERQGRMLGVLLYTDLTVSFEETPARSAIKALRAALGIIIIGRFNDDSTGHGIDPDAPITFDVEAMPAIDVLEVILDQCTLTEDCTWQLRNSFVEVGTKRRLANPGAWEVRTYPVRDLLLEPPYFAGPGLGALGSLTGGGFTNRKLPGDLAVELLDLIVDTVEPEAWEPPQPPRPDDESTPVLAPAVPDPDRAAPAAGGDPDPQKEKFRRRGKWATMRYWRGNLIVRAPDFVHRELGGTPKPIHPDRPAPETERGSDR